MGDFWDSFDFSDTADTAVGDYTANLTDTGDSSFLNDYASTETWFDTSAWDTSFDTSFLVDGLTGDTTADGEWWTKILTPANITGAINGLAGGYNSYSQTKAMEDNTNLSARQLQDKINTRAVHNASINAGPTKNNAKRALLVG